MWRRIDPRNSSAWLEIAIIACLPVAILIATSGIIPPLTGCKADSPAASVCKGCEVPPNIPIDNYPSASRDGRWSLGCRYFAVLDRHGTNMNPYYHWTVYETALWKPVCQVGEGDVMLGQGVVGGYCELPLPDGQTWVILGGNPHGRSQDSWHVRFIVCPALKTCVSPDEIPPVIR
jgi:hypothetical protein